MTTKGSEGGCTLHRTGRMGLMPAMHCSTHNVYFAGSICPAGETQQRMDALLKRLQSSQHERGRLFAFVRDWFADDAAHAGDCPYTTGIQPCNCHVAAARRLLADIGEQGGDLSCLVCERVFQLKAGEFRLCCSTACTVEYMGWTKE